MTRLHEGLNHASCVSVQNNGLLILGASGQGKSALALSLMALGGDLVGDDQVELSHENGIIIAKPAPNLAGKIEARYLGILTVDYVQSAQLRLVVDLSRKPDGRLPSASFTTVFNKKLPLVAGQDVPNLVNALYVALLNLESDCR